MVFFRGALLQANSKYLPPLITVSVVRLSDPVLLIFPSTGIDTLVPVLPVEFCWQKFTWRKNPEVKKLDGYRYLGTRVGNQISYIYVSIPVEFFSMSVFFLFFRGQLFKILTFWGLAGVRFLFLSEFYIIYRNVHLFLKKKNTSEHPWCNRSETRNRICNPERISG